MPISKTNRSRYPKDWPARRRAVLERADHCCEMCGVANYSTNPRTGSRVVLTTAHLHPPIEDCRLTNLMAMCQQCHLAYDREQHIHNRRVNRERERAKLQPALFEEIEQ